MSDRVFIDTNILVYAHDAVAGRKYDIAARLVVDSWESQNAIISTQVLQEFYVTLTRKVSPQLTVERARDLIERYRLWEVVINDVDSVLRATRIQEQFQLSFWDALIVDAAQTAECRLLYSEDLNHGQHFESVQVRNPFVDPSRTSAN